MAATPQDPVVELVVGRLSDGRLTISQRTALGRSDVYLTDERARWVIAQLAAKLDRGAFPRKAG